MEHDVKSWKHWILVIFVVQPFGSQSCHVLQIWDLFWNWFVEKNSKPHLDTCWLFWKFEIPILYTVFHPIVSANYNSCRSISIFYLINWSFAAEIIQGRKLFKGRNYIRKYDISCPHLEQSYFSSNLQPKTPILNGLLKKGWSHKMRGLQCPESTSKRGPAQFRRL